MSAGRIEVFDVLIHIGYALFEILLFLIEPVYLPLGLSRFLLRFLQVALSPG